MNILSIESSTDIASVAVYNKTTGNCEQCLITDARKFSEAVAETIMDALQQAKLTIGDIDIFAATIGPGSFTGVRSGLSFIQGLALSQNKQIFTTNTFEIFTPDLQKDSMIIIPAGKKQFYACKFDEKIDIESIENIGDEQFEEYKSSKKIANLHDSELLRPSANMLCDYILNKLQSGSLNYTNINDIQPIYASSAKMF